MEKLTVPIFEQEAAAIFRSIGSRLGEAHALGILALIRQQQGRYAEVAGYAQRALDLFREIGDREGGAEALSGLAGVPITTFRA
jgi:hypothetical protein